MEKTRPNPLPIVMIFAIAAAAVYMVISQHAQSAHQGEMYSALAVYDLIEYSVTNPGGDKACLKLEVSSCQNAKGSNGKISPQVKIACLVKGTPENGLWAVAIIGLYWGEQAPIYVTGHAENTAFLQKERLRDGCVTGDISILNQWFGPGAPRPPAMPMTP